MYLSLFLYPSTATARLLPRHPRPLPPPASTALCQIMPSESCDPLSPKTGKGHSERPAQTSSVCSGTSRLSTTLPWPYSKPHHERTKHPSQTEKRHDYKKEVNSRDSCSTIRRLRLRLRLQPPLLRPDSLSSLRLRLPDGGSPGGDSTDGESLGSSDSTGGALTKETTAVTLASSAFSSSASWTNCNAGLTASKWHHHANAITPK